MTINDKTKLTAVIYYDCYPDDPKYAPNRTPPIGRDLLELADEFLTKKDSGYQFIQDFVREEFEISVDHNLVGQPEFEHYPDGSRQRHDWCIYSRIENFPNHKATAIFRDMLKLFQSYGLFKYAIRLEGATNYTSTNIRSLQVCSDILEDK